MSQQKYYPQLNSRISFPEMEKEIIAYWEKEKTFQYPFIERIIYESICFRWPKWDG